MPRRRKKKKDKNDDLVAAALDIQDSIRAAYRIHENHKPFMEFHVQEQRVYAYPYLDYKATLSPRSQAMLTEQYEQAKAEDKIVVFIKDEQTRRLASFSLSYI
jgi:hypothetical protein